MNETVSFKIAKKLKEKGFNVKVDRYFIAPNEKVYNFKVAKVRNFKIECEKGLYESCNFNRHSVGSLVSCPTISEVLMWLYENHNIWIWVEPHTNDWNYFISTKNKPADREFRSYNMYYKSPTQAYEGAIEEVLNNLI